MADNKSPCWMFVNVLYQFPLGSGAQKNLKCGT